MSTAGAASRPATDKAASDTTRLSPGRAMPSGGTWLSSAGRLSPKLLEDAAKRLSWMAVIMAILVVLVQVLQQLAQPELASVFRDPINRLVTLIAVLASVALFAFKRYNVVPASTLVGLGMVFEVIVAFSISMVETSVPFDARLPRLGLSSLGPWIVFVGVMVPNRPVWTLVTALAAATTWPVSYAINADRLNFAPIPVSRLLVWPTINYLMAVLAFVIGRRFYGTTIAAERAQELGSYRLVAQIGFGGMGEVWKATHQMLARTAAIKLVRPEMAGSARDVELFRKRFRREANAIAALQSPHTVYLYDFGVSREGHFYYVMELLDGISLQTLVTTFGPQPASRVVFLLKQVCKSLQEAHQQGIIHRDLKPSNVMLCRVATSYDFIKVVDFGLAKPIANSETSLLTMEGVATGTPGYMAPEVAMGELSVDARADVYALGCVAYFLLTGTLVFPDPNPMSMALKHVQSVPDPPSQRTELPIPGELEALIMRCLAKKRADRPADAREIAEVLAAYGGETWSENDAAEWWDRNLPPTSSLRSFAREVTHTPPVIQKF
jgi:eukaryotic-like serine/threonine-protein kinase